MKWMKENIVSLLIAGYLGLGSLYFNDKLNEVTKLSDKFDQLKTQYFERYDQILDDQDKRLMKLEVITERDNH